MKEMIKSRLTQPDHCDIAAFLGARGKHVPEELAEQLNIAVALVMKAARPGLIYKRLSLPAPELPFSEKAAESHLRGCNGMVLFAATLGPEVDRLINRYQVNDMALAVIIDAAAGAAVENVCDNFQEDIETLLKKEGLFLSDRFSPGYGNLSPEANGSICSFLDTYRRIGLGMTEHFMLTPAKSVTAIMGISDRPLPRRGGKCETCNKFSTCIYRKESK